MAPIRMKYVIKKIKCLQCNTIKEVIVSKLKKCPVVCDDCHDSYYAVKHYNRYKKIE